MVVSPVPSPCWQQRRGEGACSLVGSVGAQGESGALERGHKPPETLHEAGRALAVSPGSEGLRVLGGKDDRRSWSSNCTHTFPPRNRECLCRSIQQGDLQGDLYQQVSLTLPTSSNSKPGFVFLSEISQFLKIGDKVKKTLKGRVQENLQLQDSGPRLQDRGPLWKAHGERVEPSSTSGPHARYVQQKPERMA